MGCGALWIISFLLASLPAARGGVPELIDFENLTAGTQVFNQYDGVTFVGGDGLNFDGSHPITIFKPTLGTVSPNRALKVAFQRACEFCGTQLIMKFDEAQFRVSLSVGLAENYQSGVTYLLQGFSKDPLVDFSSLVTQSVVPCLGTAAGAVKTPLEITDGAARIRFAILSLVDCSRPTENGSGPDNGVMLLDNLLIDRPLNPLPRESDPPIVTITFPTAGSTVTGAVAGEVRTAVKATVKETAIFNMTAAVNGHPPVQVFYFRADPDNYNAYVEVSDADGLVEGNNTVALTAVDFDRPQNQGTGTVTFKYQKKPPPPATDIVPTAVEVNQAIDGGPRSLTSLDKSTHVDGYEAFIQNSPPLLKGKATMVRVYAAASATASPVLKVPAVMTVLRDFCSSNCLVAGGLPPLASPNNPLLGGITVPVAGSPSSSLGQEATDLTKTWNFLLPADWTAMGDLVVDISINSGAYNNFPHTAAADECDSALPLTCAHNNQIRLHIHFQDGPRITVHPVLVHVTGSFNGKTFNDVKPFDSQVDEIFTQLNQLYPAIVTRGTTLDRTIGPEKTNEDLTDLMGDFDSNDGHELFIGIFPGDQGTFNENKGKIPGTIVAGTATVGGRGAWGNADNPIDPAHELGHNIGFDHWGCENGVDDDECGVFPIPHAGIGGFGVDIAHWKVIPPGDNSANNTPHAHDFMSYGQLCGLFGGGGGCDLGEWVSWYTYDILLNHPSIDSYDTDDPPALMIKGRIGADGSVSLGPVYKTAVNHPLVTTVPEDEVETIYTLQGYDLDGNTVLLHNFEPLKMDAHGKPTVLVFNEAVAPPPGDLSRIALNHGQEVMVDIRNSGLQPTVSVTSPIAGATWPIGSKQTVRWTSGPAGDPLTALVQYSSDGGATRITLAHDVTGNQLEVAPDELAGSSQALIYVSVSDGLNSAIAQSGLFTVAAKPPIVKITAPETGLQVAASVPIPFEGMGSDRQEALADSLFKWSSSLDGPLGTGRTLTVSNLTAGTHNVTLGVTDSKGLKGQDTIQVQVKGGGPGQPFHRGDSNDDGRLDLSDAVTVLAFLFSGGAMPRCKEAADANNSGRIDISDGIFILSFLFSGGPAPPSPGPVSSPCGPDPDAPGSPGALGCDSYNHC